MPWVRIPLSPPFLSCIRISFFDLRKYPRGRRGSPAKGVVRVNRSQGSNPCFSANTLKPYCSVGFFYYIFLIFIFFEHTQIKKPRAKASHQADNLTKLWQEFLSVLEMIRHGIRSVPTKQALARNYGLSLCPSYFEREKCLSG